jgi:penicillin-binding protein 1B
MIINRSAPTTTSQPFQGTSAFAGGHRGHPGCRRTAAAVCARWWAHLCRLSRLAPVRWSALGGVIAVTLAGLGFAHACAGFWRLAAHFPAAPFLQTSRLYGQPLELATGDAASTVELMAELAREGYVPVATVAYDVESGKVPLRRGTWRQEGDSLTVQLRRFPTASGPAGGGRLAVLVQGGRIARLTLGGRLVPTATLEPPLLASFYGPDVAERRPVSAAEVPRQVVQAVLAAEDDGFFTHPGVSLGGIARALWVDLRHRDLRQGGSTITQQLVKNLYCSRERTFSRKVKEALLAVIIERRYDKHLILEAYLNSIYWGKNGAVNLIGIGAAARAYFGRDPAELTLDEAAALAAMIRAPGAYAPAEHPRALLERRNRVLQRLADLGWVSRGRVRRAQAERLHSAPMAARPRPYAPYFAEIAAQEARLRFALGNLAGGGYQLFSTLDLRQQLAAEAAVASGLAAIEGARHRGHHDQPLEAALISLDPRDGAILAYVGGRDYRRSQFDRVSQARRQLGSTFKPVVYAAAFEARLATPATLLDDSPIEVRSGNTVWNPQNYDRRYRGWITARAALEQSINVPAVRMAAATGLGRIAALAQEMGIGTRPQCVPALALGALEVSPRELAQVYSTLATLGLRVASHALAAVRDRAGEAVSGDQLPGLRRVLNRESAYMVTSMLQGALDHGTGSGTRRRGVRGALAGKTGTTSDRRDSWFAGYSPERVTIVWVGYDDAAQTDLSGASAAVPLWSRFTVAVAPRGGYSDFAPPPGMVEVTIDPTNGLLAGLGCPTRVRERLPFAQAPTTVCRHHEPDGELMAAGGPEPLGDQRGVTQQATGGAPAAEPELQSPSSYAIRSGGGAWLARDLPGSGPRLALGPPPAKPSAQQVSGAIMIRPSVGPQEAGGLGGGPPPRQH